MADLSRRAFLAGCTGVGAAGVMISSPIASWHDIAYAAKEMPLPQSSGILVLISLYGGNDGLNTVVPYSNSAYYDARPELAYDAGDTLRLDSHYGLNPGMTGLASMFRDGSLAIIRGVGYPKPDRSHFRSMDIWQSASLDNAVNTGWIGRWLDATSADPMHALHLGKTVPRLGRGEKTTLAVYSHQPKMRANLDDMIFALSKADADDTSAMAMVCESYRSTVRVNQQLEALRGDAGPLSAQANSRNDLESQLMTVAACIEAAAPVRVYSVEMGGFDTHADERGTQQRLLAKLDSAITRFVERLAGCENGKNVIVAAYSEFGRRVAANASDGTDHGTAGPLFVVGERIRGGFYGEDPSLTALKDDDLAATVDFRDVYSELLSRGLRSDPEPILGKRRREIGFIDA